MSMPAGATGYRRGDAAAGADAGADLALVAPQFNAGKSTSSSLSLSYILGLSWRDERKRRGDLLVEVAMRCAAWGEGCLSLLPSLASSRTIAPGRTAGAASSSSLCV